MLPVYHKKNISCPRKGNVFLFLEGNLRRRAAPTTLLGTHQYTVYSNTLHTVINGAL